MDGWITRWLMAIINFFRDTVLQTATERKKRGLEEVFEAIEEGRLKPRLVANSRSD